MPKQAFPAAAEGMPNFNRRTFLRGTGSVLAVAGVVAAPAVVEAAESPTDRIARLADELAQALVDFSGDQFKAVVHPASHPRFPGRLELLDAVRVLSPEECVQYHLGRAARAANEIGRLREWDMGPWYCRANAGAVLAIRMDAIPARPRQ